MCINMFQSQITGPHCMTDREGLDLSQGDFAYDKRTPHIQSDVFQV